MGRDRTQHVTPDLFSTAPSSEDASVPAARAQQRRHVLPTDLAGAVKYLNDRELSLLITACLEEAKRRGRLSPSPRRESVPKPSASTGKSLPGRKVEVATISLTRGKVNAVRAAFKAGIKPALIARQFGISQSDVRKVLASDAEVRGPRAHD
jgi:hypothetical protein